MEGKALIICEDLLQQIQIRTHLKQVNIDSEFATSLNALSLYYKDNYTYFIAVYSKTSKIHNQFRSFGQEFLNKVHTVLLVDDSIGTEFDHLVLKQFNSVLLLTEISEMRNYVSIIRNDTQVISERVRYMLNPLSTEIMKLNNLEMIVLLMISEGLSTREISEKVFRSTKTIENKRYSICKKININGPNCLLKFGLRNKSQLKKLIEYETYIKKII
jgi:DNA-binding CsgD family transcriptional regulator